eukprot:COSAG02_NODE_21032_length_805_cov_1.620397_2_plen_62_part_00
MSSGVNQKATVLEARMVLDGNWNSTDERGGDLGELQQRLQARNGSIYRAYTDDCDTGGLNV